MKTIIKYFKDIFKHKVKITENISDIPIVKINIEDKDCPKCKSKGTLIFYQSFYVNDYESFYRCGNCHTKINNKEYQHLLTLSIRKQKLQKISGQSSDFTKK